MYHSAYLVRESGVSEEGRGRAGGRSRAREGHHYAQSHGRTVCSASSSTGRLHVIVDLLRESACVHARLHLFLRSLPHGLRVTLCRDHRRKHHHHLHKEVQLLQPSQPCERTKFQGLDIGRASLEYCESCWCGLERRKSAELQSLRFGGSIKQSKLARQRTILSVHDRRFKATALRLL